MNRHIAILTLGLAAVVGLSAGTIQIGSGANGANGLTAAYGVTASTTATQASGGVYGETPYTSSLTQLTTVTGSLPGSTLSAGGVTFAMINDSSNPNDELWVGTNDAAGKSTNPNPTTTTITIPMGIFGVTNVYTLMNDEYVIETTLNSSGTNNTDVTFNFGATGSSGSLTFDLINGEVIASSFDCTGGGGLAACITGGYATSVNTVNSYGTTGNVVTPATNTASVSFLGTAWSAGYSNTTVTPYANTSGNLFLDAQNFYLGSFASPSTELYNIVITDSNTGRATSRTELAAISVSQTVTTPEPSTVFLMIAGLGAVVLLSRRKLLVGAPKA